ncbi:MAG: hypothetical protein JWM80_3931 [Cyanobacteria bacterium RYN_339]|nr:hypothetical protein [Cyanobacteria bacterium RYN_339]
MITVTHRFSASPERVFDAWLDPAKIANWMVAPARKMMGTEDECLKIEVDARPGGKFSFVVRRAGEDLDHTGDYLEVDRPRRLAFTWGVPKYSKDFSTITLTFAPDGTGTLVTLEAAGVAEEYRERTQQGWTAILAEVGEHA